MQQCDIVTASPRLDEHISTLCLYNVVHSRPVSFEAILKIDKRFFVEKRLRRLDQDRRMLLFETCLAFLAFVLFCFFTLLK